MDSEGADVVTHDPTNPFQPRDMKQQLAALENGERHICGGAPSVVLTDIDGETKMTNEFNNNFSTALVAKGADHG